MKNTMLNKAKVMLPEYEVKYIDGVKCLYKKFKGPFNIEIDGLRNRYDVYVWRDNLEIVFRMQDIKVDSLKCVVEFIECMYKDNGNNLKVIDQRCKYWIRALVK